MAKKSSAKKANAKTRTSRHEGTARTASAATLEMENVGAAVVIVDRSGSVVRASGWEKIADAPVPSRIPPVDDLPDQLLDGIAAAIEEARRLSGPTRRVVAVELDKRRFYSVSAGAPTPRGARGGAPPGPGGNPPLRLLPRQRGIRHPRSD